MSRLADIGGRYRQAIRHLRSCCNRVETLLSSDKVRISDVELIYESAFLNATARFEGLLNEVLEEIVCGKSSNKAGHYSLIQPRSRKAFRAILTGRSGYVDLMPMRQCVEVSERFVNEGKPFSDVADADKHLVSQIVLIRNAIAHRSDSALKKFRRDVAGVGDLSPHRQFPGAYLRRQYRANPVERWNDLYLNTLEKVGANLASSW